MPATRSSAGPDGVTAFFISLRVRKRFPIRLRQDLRAVMQKCRPDWDITNPELKAAWEQGQKDRFYPYGKSYAKVLGEQE